MKRKYTKKQQVTANNAEPEVNSNNVNQTGTRIRNTRDGNYVRIARPREPGQ